MSLESHEYCEGCGHRLSRHVVNIYGQEICICAIEDMGLKQCDCLSRRSKREEGMKERNGIKLLEDQLEIDEMIKDFLETGTSKKEAE